MHTLFLPTSLLLTIFFLWPTYLQEPIIHPFDPLTFLDRSPFFLLRYIVRTTILMKFLLGLTSHRLPEIGLQFQVLGSPRTLIARFSTRVVFEKEAPTSNRREIQNRRNHGCNKREKLEWRALKNVRYIYDIETLVSSSSCNKNAYARTALGWNIWG